MRKITILTAVYIIAQVAINWYFSWVYANLQQLSTGSWEKLGLSIKQLDKCGWTSTSSVLKTGTETSVSRTLEWWSSNIVLLLSNIFVSVLYFKAFNKLIDGTTDRLQQAGFLVYKNIQGLFVKLCNLNNYVESINWAADMDETDFKLGDSELQLGQFSKMIYLKDAFIGKIIEILSDFKISELFNSAKLLSCAYSKR